MYESISEIAIATKVQLVTSTVTVAIAPFAEYPCIRDSDVRKLPVKTCNPVAMDSPKKETSEKIITTQSDVYLDGAKDGNDGRGI